MAQVEGPRDGRAITWQADAKGFRFSRQNDNGKGTEYFDHDPQLRPRAWHSLPMNIEVQPRRAVVLNSEWVTPPLSVQLSDGEQRIRVERNGAGRVAVQ